MSNPKQYHGTMLPVLIGIFGLLSIACLGLAISAFRRRRLLRGGAGGLGALLFLSLAALAATIAVATHGYRAFTREDVVATVTTRPTAGQRFEARVVLPDGRDTTYRLAGDQLYVDAHILKWKPLANLIGLHTTYELDRIGGRYFELGAERDSVRTIESLKANKPLDMFALRQRYAAFAPLLDAEYGSATFVPADRPATWTVLVSTTGLLVRPADTTR